MEELKENLNINININIFNYLFMSIPTFFLCTNTSCENSKKIIFLNVDILIS